MVAVFELVSMGVLCEMAVEVGWFVWSEMLWSNVGDVMVRDISGRWEVFR